MAEKVTLEKRIKGAVLGSFVGDALALGVHWIYNPKKIESTHGRVNDYVNPDRNQYHKVKKIGDLTYYGDQTLELGDVPQIVKTRWG